MLQRESIAVNVLKLLEHLLNFYSKQPTSKHWQKFQCVLVDSESGLPEFACAAG